MKPEVNNSKSDLKYSRVSTQSDAIDCKCLILRCSYMTFNSRNFINSSIIVDNRSKDHFHTRKIRKVFWVEDALNTREQHPSIRTWPVILILAMIWTLTTSHAIVWYPIVAQEEKELISVLMCLSLWLLWRILNWPTADGSSSNLVADMTFTCDLIESFE